MITFPAGVRPLLFRTVVLSTLAILSLSLTACSSIRVLPPREGEPVKVLKLDPTSKPSTVDADGARWVLFKLDFGGRARTALRGAATVGQALGESVGNSVAQLRPEEQIFEMIQSSRASAAVTAATPSLPLTFAR